MLASPPLTLMVNSQVKHTDKWTLLAASHVTVYIQVRGQKGKLHQREESLFFFCNAVCTNSSPFLLNGIHANTEHSKYVQWV